MSRIGKLNAYLERKDEEYAYYILANESMIISLRNKIRALGPRIEELLKIANVCYKNDIDIEKYIASTKHQIGFIKDCSAWNTNPLHEFEKIGFEIGEEIGSYYFNTDGVNIYNVRRKTCCPQIPTLEHMKKFLREFDQFEKDFFNYIDALVEN